MTETSPTVDDMMSAYAEDAVEHANQVMGIALDYSPDSVAQVEELAARLHDAIPRGFLARLFRKGPSTDEIATICKMYGGYVGEVLRRSGGGEWVLDDQLAPGQQAICLRKADHRVWPAAKLQKRITNGPEDDVWHYFQVIHKDWGGSA